MPLRQKIQYVLLLFHIHTRECAGSGSDEVPVGEGWAGAVVREGVEPGYCSSYLIIRSNKSATRLRGTEGK